MDIRCVIAEEINNVFNLCTSKNLELQDNLEILEVMCKEFWDIFVAESEVFIMDESVNSVNRFTNLIISLFTTTDATKVNVYITSETFKRMMVLEF